MYRLQYAGRDAAPGSGEPYADMEAVRRVHNLERTRRRLDSKGRFDAVELEESEPIKYLLAIWTGDPIGED
jgi:hypothetical protein